jgi:hypothetical protein
MYVRVIEIVEKGPTAYIEHIYSGYRLNGAAVYLGANPGEPKPF